MNVQAQTTADADTFTMQQRTMGHQLGFAARPYSQAASLAVRRAMRSVVADPYAGLPQVITYTPFDSWLRSVVPQDRR